MDKKRWRRWLLRMGTAMILGVVFLMILDGVLRSGRSPEAPLPNPNGYDDLVRAGKMVTRLENQEEASTEELRRFVDRHSEALRIARTGLHRECRIPRFTTDRPPTETFMPLFDLRLLFEAEGTLAEKEGRPADALRSYLDLYQLGYQLIQGGCWIDFLISSGAQTTAIPT